jgi:hypothetical protein
MQGIKENKLPSVLNNVAVTENIKQGRERKMKNSLEKKSAKLHFC